MTAQVEGTATDRVHGHPTKIIANPGDVIIFDKRLGHFGGPARSLAKLRRNLADPTWLPSDPNRPITDASWHIHLDDARQEEPRLSDGTDPVYYVHQSASPSEVRCNDQLDNARGSGDTTDGHLGSTKAAGELDAEYVLRAGRYDSRKDEEWRKNTSAETEAANLKLAIQWEKENAKSGDRRERSRRRKRPGPK